MFRKWYRFWNAVLLAGLAGLTALLASAKVTPAGLQLFYSTKPLPTLCPIRAKTGVDCPTCGLTRSCVVLLQGNYRGSFDFHPYGRLIVAFIAIQLLIRAALLLPRGHEYWKVDVALTSTVIVLCFGPFLLR